MSDDPARDRDNLADAERIAKAHPEWAAFVAWARSQNQKYEAERRAWRAQNPLIDVKALEDAYGITQETQTIEQLKSSAPAVIIRTPDT